MVDCLIGVSRRQFATAGVAGRGGSATERGGTGGGWVGTHVWLIAWVECGGKQCVAAGGAGSSGAATEKGGTGGGWGPCGVVDCLVGMWGNNM